MSKELEDGSSWYEGSNTNKNLMTLRKALDLYNKDEINTVLFTYTRTMELMISNFPDKPVIVKIDWAIANALSPDWFGDALTTRVQNGMLVAALLLTVTAANFVSPVQDSVNQSRYRGAMYINGICTISFLTSIFLGVCFIENGMSRAYSWADRFYLIVQQYSIKDMSQILAIVATLLFPVALLLPLQTLYLKGDCIALYVFSLIIGVILVYAQIVSMKAAAAKQNERAERLRALTDPATGRLLPQFQPPAENLADADKDESVQAVFEAMYRKDEVAISDGGLCGCIKLQ
eukprot:gene6946-9500_t